MKNGWKVVCVMYVWEQTGEGWGGSFVGCGHEGEDRRRLAASGVGCRVSFGQKADAQSKGGNVNGMALLVSWGFKDEEGGVSRRYANDVSRSGFFDNHPGLWLRESGSWCWLTLQVLKRPPPPSQLTAPCFIS
eukprot:Hpha_TRINITY_DN16056_c2_g3::TRINITY_DN16056_c2_g3_i4::g.121308::m.121308